MDKITQIVYITRVNLDSPSAQARQITSMSLALRAILGEKFSLVSVGKPIQGKLLNHFEISTLALFPIGAYASACWATIKRCFASQDFVVLTRDIAIAITGLVFGRRVIYESHRDHKSRISRLLIRIALKFNTFDIICISDALKQYYRDVFSVPSVKILVAHDGVFIKNYIALWSQDKEKLRAALDLPKDHIILLHTGSLYKGGAELFSICLDECEDIFMLHIGGSVAECRYWQNYYQQGGYSRIKFVPHIASHLIPKYQVAADLLFYVSTNESPINWCTSPLKIFEYMASGTPIVGSNIGSVSEILDRSVAFLFNPSSGKELSAAIRSAIKNPDLAYRKAKKAKAMAAHFDWHIRGQKVIEFIERS